MTDTIYESIPDISDCFKPNKKLTSALYDGMEALYEGDNQTAYAKFMETKPLYKEALSGCGARAD